MAETFEIKTEQRRHGTFSDRYSRLHGLTTGLKQARRILQGERPCRRQGRILPKRVPSNKPGRVFD